MTFTTGGLDSTGAIVQANATSAASRPTPIRTVASDELMCVGSRTYQAPPSGPCKIGLNHGVEIRRVQRVGVDAAVPGRNAACSAEADGQMREVAAHTGFTVEHICGRSGGRGRAGRVGEMPVNPFANGVDATKARLQSAELGFGKIGEGVRLAKPAR